MPARAISRLLLASIRMTDVGGPFGARALIRALLSPWDWAQCSSKGIERWVGSEMALAIDQPLCCNRQ